jgi:hypothetical protein
MAGLVPAIHALLPPHCTESVDARHKQHEAEHDDRCYCAGGKARLPKPAPPAVTPPRESLMNAA